MPPLQPEESAKSLLRGYRYQDRRMKHLLTGKYTRARYEEKKAIEEMAKAYSFEFPRAAENEKAGRHFMRASFMQDEIENWPNLLSANVPKCCLNIPYTHTVRGIQADPRWQTVATELETTCELAGISNSYVESKIKFLKFHELENPKYTKFARQAECAKIMAMGDISEKRAKELAQYFIQGVQQHDQWNAYESVDKTTVEIVSEFYHQVQRERSHEKSTHS